MTPRERVSRWLEEHEVEAAWFARPNNFAWLTGGDNRISKAAPVGDAAVGYDGETLTVLASNIEAQRLQEEELPPGIEVESFPWYESLLGEAIVQTTPTPAVADFDVPGLGRIDAADLRQPLHPEAIEIYRSLRRDVVEAVESVLRDVSSTDSEREVAARLQYALTGRGITTPVVLVGSAERAQQYRHYTVTDELLGEYALVSVSSEREGLYTSLTRTVAFDAPDWLTDRTEAANRVETTALAATRAVGREGGKAKEVFAAIQDAYAEVGYPGEWGRHHQGGAAGYAGREWVATPENDATVKLPMAYAWNPTVQGAKSEGTVLVSEEEIDLLTEPLDWPTREVEAVGYDLTLERPAALHL
ncbi:MAG: M24 family metallopeptidase [Halobacteriales archaeon]